MASNEKKNDEFSDDTGTEAAGESVGADANAVVPLRGKAASWLEQVDSEVERLRRRNNETRDELDRCEARNRELERESAQLRADLNGLQTYIDGRKDRWAEMQQRVEQYEDTLAGMEQVVRDAEDKLTRKDGERELLSNRIIGLERRCAELAGRLQERERGERDDQRRLQQTTEELETARAELSRTEVAANEAAAEARQQAELTESLERGIARRDQTIEELERKIEELRNAGKALDGDKDQRIARLEQELAALGRQRSGSPEEVRSLRQELVAQQNLIGKLEAELDAKQELIEALRRQIAPDGAEESGLAAPPSETNGGGTEGEREGGENVEIIHIGDLFRHRTLGDRQPIAMLEAPDGTTYPVTKPSITIGRASSNDICIRREFISRTHARLTIRGIGAIIEDAGSKNGILVNSEPVGRRVLADGDIVSLGGKLDLKYVEIDGASRAGVPSPQAESEADI